MSDISTKQVALSILDVARHYKTPIGFMIFLAIFWSIDFSLHPYLLKLMLNGVAEGKAEDIFATIGVPALLYVLLAFTLSTLFRFYDYLVSIKMIPSMRKRIAQKYLEKLTEQSHHYYQNQFSGSLANKINDLTGSIPDLIQITIDRFFSHFLMLIVATFTLWQVHRVFALIMFCWATFFVGLSIFLAKRLTRLADVWSECASTITGRMVDSLTNMLSVRLFAKKRHEMVIIEESLDAAVAAEKRLNWNYFWVWFSYGYSFIFTLSLNLYFLLKGRQMGTISVGDFALVITLNLAIVELLWQLTREFSQFTKFFGRIVQAIRTIDQPVEIVDAPNAKALAVTQGEIQFDRVKFNYRGNDALFKEKSITIQGGQKVGLVGYSGSGKSTFVNLILRLYDVSGGTIRIDGMDIREVTQDSLHAQIAMIPQDPNLFHRSLLENIRYGKPGSTEDEVIKAAKKAHAHDFIKSIPEGYGAMVGERGVKLSGGQRQRIAIARAILKNAPILILDEATSQLDSVTEGDIQESLWPVMEGKTTIVIAHRLSTLLHMDRILVFNKGQIVEDGSHQELLKKSGHYKTLWDAQVGGFLPEA